MDPEVISKGGLSPVEFEQALTHPDWGIRKAAVKLGGLSYRQLTRALGDPMFDVRHSAQHEASLLEAKIMAKQKTGLECFVVDANSNRAYSGAVLWNNEFHVAQSIGREVAIHLKTNLSRLVVDGEKLHIVYGNNKGIVSRQAQDLGKGVGR